MHVSKKITLHDEDGRQTLELELVTPKHGDVAKTVAVRAKRVAMRGHRVPLSQLRAAVEELGS